MKRKVMSAIMALCLLVSTMGWSAMPALAEGVGTGDVPHVHENILLQKDSKIENGHYFLDKDWLLKSAQTLRVTGDATICLNGHKIDANGKSLQIIVLDGAKLTLCDCDNTLRAGHLDARGLWHEGAAVTGEVDMPIYGGVITGLSSYLQLVSSIGEFYLESGNIAGNVILGTAAIFKTQNQGKVIVNGGTCVGNLGSIIKVDVDGSGKTDAGFGEINGGKIIQNHASAATIKNYGTLAVTGGSITENQSDVEAGGIQNTSKATLQLSGNPLIKNNIGKDGRNNVYLEEKPIEITGALQSSAPIGIGMATLGPITNGWQTHMNGQAPSKYFSADQTGLWVSEENDEAILTNQKPALKAPAITKQPQSLILTQGEGGTLSVEATAEEDATLSYQWYQATDATSTANGVEIKDETDASLAIDKNAPAGTTYYYCVVTANRDGVAQSVKSAVATVMVDARPVSPDRPSKPKPPTEQPGETVTNPDGSVTTTVTKPNGMVVATTKYPNGDCMILSTAPSGEMDVTFEGAKERLVTIPVEALGPEIVAYVTDANGMCRLEMRTAVTEMGMTILVHDGDSIELVQKTVNFTDVPDQHWAKAPITYVAARGLLIGVEDTLFAPSMQTSRAMTWSILARLEGVQLEETTPWYASSQAWAVDVAISDGNNPNAEISREQLVTMLYRYANSPAVNSDLTAYSDGSQVSAWAVDAVQWAVSEGIMNGITADTLAPQETATRAQTAAILERFIAWQLSVA